MPQVGGIDLGDTSLFLKVGEEKEIHKGLKKKLVKEGEGHETPKNGDEVEVHVTGTLLDGTKFDSSLNEGIPFKFILGQGQVINGWDIGIKTMKKGESAVFTIPSELAFVESGSRPTNPGGPIVIQSDANVLTWIQASDSLQEARKAALFEGNNQNYLTQDSVINAAKNKATLEFGTGFGKSDRVELTGGLTNGQVAKAMKTMIKPSSDGGQSSVLPNAMLEINLELVSWKKVSEVSDDNKIMEKILKEGEGYEGTA
ncbi:FKBP-type peptidyl-prolyl cis-trans isomerase domain [Arabidopsis suecica]|uniref:peptidylprolyl isomerase n=1 Tax=Arabidopsis suecica TaxID=45249 RepID=A0A8T2B7Q0_ARASU|nr:FKBP-type peptidyl-prolyl cis-trans isomerase domain [Arabidopsis suecica]